MIFLIFLLLLLPGYVGVKHLWPHEEECGLPGMIGLSFLATLGILSPFSILGYLLNLPVGAFAIICVMLVVAAPIEISRNKWWRDAGRLLLTGATLATGLLLFDVILSARAGAYIFDDALIHMARIRNILNHGLNNTDPFVTPDYFFPMYHTNLLYALIAAISKVTGTDPIVVWANSLTWVKLLVASGSYYLAYTIFGRRWSAWAAAIFVIGVQGPVRYLIYPNKLAPFWLLPIVFAFAAQIIAQGADWRRFLKLLVGSLVLGQLHAMYAVFAAMVLSPTLLANAIFRLIKPATGRLWPILCCATLGIGLSFAWVAHAGFTSTRTTEVRENTLTNSAKTAADYAKSEKRIRKLDDGRVVRIWGYGYFAHHAMRPWILFAALTLSLVTRRRKYAIVPALIVILSLAWLFIPTFCTTFMEQVRRPFIILRFESVFRVCFYAVVPGLAVFGLENLLRGDIWGRDREACRSWSSIWNRRPAVRWIVEGVVCLIVLMLIVPYKNYGKPLEDQNTGWERYWTRVKAPASTRAKRRNDLLKLGEHLSTHVQPGAVIAVSPREARSMLLPAVVDCHLIAPRAGSTGVPDLQQRRLDLMKIYTRTTTREQRLALLKKYKADYAIGPETMIPENAVAADTPLWKGQKLIRLRDH